MIGVLVSGSGTNLQALLDADLSVVAVASNKPGAYALERASHAGVATATFALEEFGARIERDGAMADWLESCGVRLVVCAGYMHLLSPRFLERFPSSVVNVHPSLLPAFPGMNAVDDALAAGVAATGVTVHYVDEGVDTGPVIEQVEVPIVEADTPESLHERIHEVEHRLLPEVVGRLVEAIPSAATP
ncbi:MAG: phosphoribosylglycinamide formyltransferase [Gaiellaceae bacterium]